ncbi:MAG: recombinase family protein [Oscillospiraceae bacterium]|nr:recombinase family protein [Oscillospiraceae bacterium]
MKAVIYARYSSDNQTENSIEGQLRECKNFAERNGMTVIGNYIDRALSAKTDSRPQFQKMIKDSAKSLFDVVIVWKLDRFARNRYDSAHYKAILRKNSVKVVSATEPISEDSTGILLESLLEGYAEFFSAELSEKVKRGMNENALKCKWNGGGIPIGYTIDNDKNYQIDPIASPFVLEAFKRYADGSKFTELAQWMNDNGVKSYRNLPISINTINRMLKNRAYIGVYHYDIHQYSRWCSGYRAV